MSTFQDEVILLEGWLLKRNSRGIGRNWSRRYFIVTEGNIAFSKSQESRKRSCLPMSKIDTLKMQEDKKDGVRVDIILLEAHVVTLKLDSEDRAVELMDLVLRQVKKSKLGPKMLVNIRRHSAVHSNVTSSIRRSSIILGSSRNSYAEEPVTKRMEYEGVGTVVTVTDLGFSHYGRIEVVVMEHDPLSRYWMLTLNTSMPNSTTVRGEKIIEESSELRHPFLIELLNSGRDLTGFKSWAMFLFPECGSLFTHLQWFNRFDEESVGFFLAQLVITLDVVHKHGLLLPSLDPEHIFLNKSGFLVVTDFRMFLSRAKNGRKYEETSSLKEYVTPEFISDRQESIAADWWRLGILAYELLVGLPPFVSSDPTELFTLIFQESLEFPDFVSEAARDLITRLLTKDQDKRLGYPAVKKHPFFVDVKWKQLSDLRVRPPEGVMRIVDNVRNVNIVPGENSCSVSVTSSHITDVVKLMESSGKNRDFDLGLRTRTQSIGSIDTSDEYGSRRHSSLSPSTKRLGLGPRSPRPRNSSSVTRRNSSSLHIHSNSFASMESRKLSLVSTGSNLETIMDEKETVAEEKLEGMKEEKESVVKVEKSIKINIAPPSKKLPALPTSSGETCLKTETKPDSQSKLDTLSVDVDMKPSLPAQRRRSFTHEDGRVTPETRRKGRKSLMVTGNGPKPLASGKLNAFQASTAEAPRQTRVMDLIADKVRGVVSKKKKRFKKDGFDLDLTYITQDLIAMGFPTDESSIEGIYRNPMSEVQRFFRKYHQDHYMIYNLCAEPQYQYTDEAFGYMVGKFQFYDHNAPSFHLLVDFCKTAESYLKTHPDNIVAVHCKAGKGRTGTMIAAYLLHIQYCPTAEEALQLFGQERTADGKGVTIPSQIRYVGYYERFVNEELGDSFDFSGKKISVTRLVVKNPPRGFNPALKVLRLDGQVLLESKDWVPTVGIDNGGAIFGGPWVLCGDVKFVIMNKDVSLHIIVVLTLE